MHYSGTVAAVREAVLHGWPALSCRTIAKRESSLIGRAGVNWVILILTGVGGAD